MTAGSYHYPAEGRMFLINLFGKKVGSDRLDCAYSKEQLLAGELQSHDRPRRLGLPVRIIDQNPHISNATTG